LAPPLAEVARPDRRSRAEESVNRTNYCRVFFAGPSLKKEQERQTGATDHPFSSYFR
jgi:hypothetical protein